MVFFVSLIVVFAFFVAMTGRVKDVDTYMVYR